MNRTHTLGTAFVVGVLALITLSGCSSQPETSATTANAETTGARPSDLLAPCNLGEKWDSTAMLKVARYDAPAVDKTLLEEYGPTLANGSCTDAEIIKWQELRRETGDSDQICRITWYDDYFSAVTYPIGCAVPVLVVTDASR